MLLLIDADQNHNTGWYGYDYLVNQKIVDEKTTTLMRYDAMLAGRSVGRSRRGCSYRYAGNAAGNRRAAQAARLEGRRFHASIFTGATIRPT